MRKNDIDNSRDTLCSKEVIDKRDDLGEDISSGRLSEISDRLEDIELGLEEDDLTPDGRLALTTALDELEAEKKKIEGGDLSQFGDHDDHEEWKEINDFVEEFEGDVDRGGETLIRESYFVEYAQDLAGDVCDDFSKRSQQWPFSHIDWEAAAKELKQDYSSAEFDGVTYYYRST